MKTDSKPLAAFRRKLDARAVSEGAYAEASDVLLFVHIPKTAGMSVGRALQRKFDVFHPVSWDNIGPSFRQKTREALYLRSDGQPRRQVLMGHFGWSEVMFWRNQDLPIKCAAIIRDPVARLVSNYEYNCSDKHPGRDRFIERFPTLESYAQALPRDYQLSTLIGLFWDFDHALELLAQNYTFLGITELLGASLEHFSRSHGLGELREYRENASPASEIETPGNVREMVLERSRNDLRLHALVSEFYSGSDAPARPRTMRR